jgi:uncharacterized protein YggE
MQRIIFASLFGLAMLAGARAESLKDSTPHISVTGEAFEKVAPDEATLFIGVVTERPTAADAANENARKTKAVLDELAAQGVDAKDVETQGLTLTPYVSEESESRGGAKRVSKGFRARDELAVKVKVVEKAGVIAERSIDSGANEIAGVAFAISDEAARFDRLRELAIKDAEHRATTYVEAIGLKLGRVMEIRPETENEPMQPRAAGVATRLAAPPASVPLRPGMQSLISRVTVTWALTR